MAGKLTPLQLETLRLIADGKVQNVRFGYGAWRIQGANPSTVGRLASMKLVSWGAMENDRQSCGLTAAGRAALSQEDGR